MNDLQAALLKRLLGAAITLLAGCGSGGELAEIKSHWELEVASYFTESRDTVELNSWLASKGISAVDHKPQFEPQELIVTLEDFQTDGIVCSSWAIQLKLEVDDQGQIVSHKVDQAGRCL